MDGRLAPEKPSQRLWSERATRLLCGILLLAHTLIYIVCAKIRLTHTPLNIDLH